MPGLDKKMSGLLKSKNAGVNLSMIFSIQVVFCRDVLHALMQRNFGSFSVVGVFVGHIGEGTI